MPVIFRTKRSFVVSISFRNIFGAVNDILGHRVDTNVFSDRQV